jgi:hypothetical protein
MRKKKLKWGKPKLIVLTKGEPEERVLSMCKAGSGVGASTAANNYCYLLLPVGPINICGACSTTGS